MEEIRFQNLKVSKSLNQTDGGRRKKYKKRYSSRQRSRRKHADNRNSKSHSKLTKLEVKQQNYSSEYIGTKRLTKHMGFLSKGKISDSISRYENTLPDNLRARAQQDLHRVLRISNDSCKNSSVLVENGIVNSNKRVSRDLSGSCNDGNFSQRVVNSDLSSSCSSQHSFVRNIDINTRTDNGNHLTAGPPVSEKSPTPVKRAVADPISESQKENQFCFEVTKRLHNAIAKVNASMFPNASNQSRLITEFLRIKKEYISRKAVDDSSDVDNVKLSQHSLPKEFESCAEDDFELNPVLMQETKVESLQTIFPESQTSSSESDVIPLNPSCSIRESRHQDSFQNKSVRKNLSQLYSDAVEDMDVVSASQNAEVSDHFSSQRSLNSSRTEYQTYKRASPVSDSDSPVWVRNASPLKFKPFSAPTPKIYYRRKMF